MTRRVLLAAVSGRALAAAARRAGYAPVVLDLFNDLDTRALASESHIVGSLQGGFKARTLLATAKSLPELPLVYGSGFEARPALLARLAKDRPLHGNSPETVARIKDPRRFFELLDCLSIPHPEVRLAAPADPSGWLTKRVGGAGGAHIRPARRGERGAGRYFQRRAEGEAVSALFLANGREALVLGMSVQWRAEQSGRGFLFGGAAQPAAVPSSVAEGIESLLQRLVQATGLVGLNSADFLLRDDGFDLLEINPRPGATLDVFDQREDRPLFALHLAACGGELPPAWQAPPGATASAVVYAPRALTVPAAFQWPDWAADLPEHGSAIPAGAPVCTVLAQAAGLATARRLVRQRGAEILRRLGQPGEAARVSALAGAA